MPRCVAAKKAMPKHRRFAPTRLSAKRPAPFGLCLFGRWDYVGVRRTYLQVCPSSDQRIPASKIGTINPQS